MVDQVQAAVGPVREGERIRELDILRGVALLGVLIMNFVAFASAGVMATDEQLMALPTIALDEPAYEAVRLFVGDKANTVFATLFGLGFYLQLKRGAGRPGFESRYRRRLFWLLVFGWLNSLFLWVWDILNLYALAGFALLAMRNWSTRALVIFGAAAALYSDKLQAVLVSALGLPVPGIDHVYSDAWVLERQSAALSGSYPDLVAVFWKLTLNEWLLGGVMVAWIVYALGRFALGAAIGRSGILENVDAHIPLLRKVAWIAIPLGLAVGLWIRLVDNAAISLPGSADAWASFAEVLRSPAALLLAAGYCAGIVVALRRGWGQRLFGNFAPVGQMALTNYLAQGFLYAFVMFDIGPGLGLSGRIGSFTVVLICLAFFVLQILFSRWWLSQFRFGPMEWLWRALTYGELPPMRRAPVAAVAA